MDKQVTQANQEAVKSLGIAKGRRVRLSPALKMAQQGDEYGQVQYVARTGMCSVLVDGSNKAVQIGAQWISEVVA